MSKEEQAKNAVENTDKPKAVPGETSDELNVEQLEGVAGGVCTVTITLQPVNDAPRIKR